MLLFSTIKHRANLRYSRQFAMRFLLCTLLPLPNYAQTPAPAPEARWREAGPPFMQKYTASDYGGTHQIWCITQNRKHGLMYFTNRGAVLEFDGVSWRRIPTGESMPVRMLEEDATGRIWVAGFHEIGYLAPDSLGFLQFRSLRDYVPPQIRESTKEWSLALTRRGVYFQAGRFLLRWSEKSRTMKIWRSETGFGVPRAHDDALYIRKPGVGLMRMAGDSLRLLPGGERFAQTVIYALLPYADSEQELAIQEKTNADRPHAEARMPFLLATHTHGLFIYDGHSFRPFQTEAAAYLKKNRLRCGVALPDGSYAFGTLHGGLVIIGPQGKLRLILTKAEGLHDNSIYHAYYDTRNGLWLALNKGIMRLEYPSPFSLFTSPPALRSSVNAIVQHQGKLYTTTTEGVYTKEPDSKPGRPPLFRAIAGLKAQTGRLSSAGGRLLIGSNQGIDQLVLDREKSPRIEVTKVAKTNTPGCLVPSRFDSTRLYVGLQSRLGLLKLRSGSWQYAGSVPVGNDMIEGVAEADTNTLWLTTRYGTVLRLTAPSLEPSVLLNSAAVKIERFDAANGLPDAWGEAFVVDGRVLFTTTKGLRHFDPETRAFPLDSSFAGLFADSTWQFNWSKFEFDERGRIWTTRSGHYGVATPQPNGSYSWNETPFLRLANLGGIWTFCIDRNDDGVYWFGGVFGIARYDETIPKDDSAAYPALIRRIIVNGDSAIYGGAYADPGSVMKRPNLAFDNNTLRFEFAAPYYDDPASNRYQFFLEGFDKGWSNWTDETTVDYRQLPEGRYRFRVRARNIYNNIGGEAAFALKILPPWYHTWWSYVLYGVLVVGLLYSFRRYELNRQRHKHRAELKHVQAEKLKELDTLKSDFFANISHEFRTPLTLILGPTEQLLEKQTGDDKSKLSLIRRNAHRLLRLIDQLLDLSKLESNKLHLQARPGDFIAFLKGLVMSFESLADRKSIDLQFVANDSRSLDESYFDRDKIEKIFTNVLSNAFKFTPAGGRVRVTVERIADCRLDAAAANAASSHEILHPRCQLCMQDAGKPGKDSATPSSNCVEVTIADTGEGISSGQLPHIFDRFYQVDSSSRRMHGGTGIGLALVKEMVDLHHGSIVVNSEEGKGTTFTICLPLGRNHLKPEEIVESVPSDQYSVIGDQDIEDDVRVQPEQRTTSIQYSEIQNPKSEIVLLIEDNADVRAYIREQLQNDYTILEAADGEAGIAKAIETIPDLVISDVMMPKKDGYEVCRTLKTDQRTSHIPVILLTAKARAQEKLAGLETGADAYVLKPFRQQELAARVRNLIALRRKLRAKYSTATTIKPSEIEATSMDREFLQRVVAAIEANMVEEHFSAEALAREVAMSVSQLNRKLNALIGQPAGQLIRSLRLQRAADLLTKKSGTVTEICYAVGFGEQANFSRAFKKQFGCSPSEYQKTHHKK